jgi:hypothetical protein
VSDVAERLRWTVRAMCLLRRTTRPRSLYPATILDAGERKMMESAYASNWTPKDFVRLLVKRDKVERTA